MTRWLLLICLTGFVNALPREKILAKSRIFKHHRHAVNDNATNADSTTMCDTKECRYIAEYITKSMDKSVDPCDDFYKFACGKWADNYPIPPHMSHWDMWTVIKHNINIKIRDFVESDINKDDLLPVKFAKKWYRSCMDEKTIERVGLEPVESALQRIGGWPITMETNEWDEENYLWYMVERYYVRLSGIMSTFKLDSTFAAFNPGDKHAYVILLNPPSLPLSKDLPKRAGRQILYEGDSYENLIVGAAMELIKLRRATVSKETVINDAKDIIDFERKLYKIVGDKDDGDKIFPESKMYASKNDKHWKKWKREIREDCDDDDSDDSSGGGSGDGSGDGENNDSDDDGNDDDDDDSEGTDDDEDVTSPDDVLLRKFQKNINVVLKGFFKEKTDNVTKLFQSMHVIPEIVRPIAELLEETPTRTIVNYIHWNFVSHLLKYTTNHMRELHFEVLRKYEGLKDLPPRWESCVTEIKMTDILSYVYVKKYFSDDIKEVGTEMIAAVRKQIKTLITESGWMNGKVKKIVIQKIDKMKAFIGYPQWYENVTEIETYYKGLLIGRQHMDNVLSYTKYEKMQVLDSSYLKRKMKSMWLIDPLTVNAIYMSMVNTFVIPAADFQEPFFALAQPDYINFGIVGLIIAHEISHGYDSNGRNMDKDGRFIIWPTAMNEEYMKRQKCFVEQYNNYTFKVPGTNITLKVNSEKTVHENIADSAGLQAQFSAYKHWMKEKNVPHVTLPGLEKFTEDQLFFIAFANMWCESTTPEHIKYITNTDVHTTNSLRVIGGLSNSEDFARAYQCPPNSPMNPSKKCTIWK